MPWIALCYSHGERELEITLSVIEKTLIMHKKALGEGTERYPIGRQIKNIQLKIGEFMVENRRKVGIIGAGQLGSRHLQALKNVEMPLDIYVYDNNNEPLQVAKNRYNSMMSSSNILQNVHYCNIAEAQNFRFDLIIIATGSKPRAELTKWLIQKNDIKKIIFEKILFQRKEDYFEVGKLLHQKHIESWVNCPRRTWEIYRGLKLKTNSPIHVNINGSNWGLMCNLIHFVDLVAYLIDCRDFEINTLYLNPEIIFSKRKGYLELTGSLGVRFQDGSMMQVCENNDGNLPVFIEISDRDSRHLIFEQSGTLISQSKNNDFEIRLQQFVLPYQSEMTTHIAREILNNNTCGLTSFEESAKLHIQCATPIINFLNNNTDFKEEIFPFT